jgi:predicted nucleic acid-binding Zn finger protein
MISKWYARRMEAWEQDLCSRATNRVVRPFEWGVDWVERWPAAARNPRNGYSEEEYIRKINAIALTDSSEFFAYEKPQDFEFDGQWARFRSPVETPHAANNTVHLRYFRARSKRGPVKKAVIVLPHWNSSENQHVALCRGLQKLGLSSVRVSLPYHDRRMPPELERADYAVSSNIGRTLDATRQAVLDVRASIDWLQSRGYEKFAIVGTSLGSCYAFLASSHDERILVNAFNHCSAYFADVVWTGLSTQHIKESLEANISLDRLRKVWDILSPSHYMDRFAALPKKSLFIYTRYDTTFLPQFAEIAVDHIRQRGLDHRVVVLPCGHYTMGESPFKFIDGYHICSFLKRNL